MDEVRDASDEPLPLVCAAASPSPHSCQPTNAGGSSPPRAGREECSGRASCADPADDEADVEPSSSQLDHPPKLGVSAGFALVVDFRPFVADAGFRVSDEPRAPAPELERERAGFPAADVFPAQPLDVR